MSSLPSYATQMGAFHPDGAGLYHYIHGRATGHVDYVAADALACRPTAPCWFWFNDTPAPMHPRDTAETLVRRWGEIREAYQSRSLPLLLVKLCDMEAAGAGS